MQFYLIHGMERKRRIFMEAQFRYFGIPASDVVWINSPNKEDVLPNNICVNPSLTSGQIAITYKHFLALKDIVEKKLDYAVIMEDNIEFLSNVPQVLERYLTQLPKDWDCLFDSDFFGWKFVEGPISETVSVYKKSNQATKQCHGSSKGAHFYMINGKAAEKMIDQFIPFNAVSDHYLNSIFQKLNLNVYWAEPPNVHKIQRASTWK